MRRSTFTVFLAILAVGIPGGHRTLAAQESPKLPDSAKPAKELAPLAFMAGRWVGVNPNQTVNEEHWMAPRGNHMVGTFRQVRRDGKPAFVEVTLIYVEEGKVHLKLRHLHTKLEVPETRKETSDFELQSTGFHRATFQGVGASKSVSVEYRLVGFDELRVEVKFAPETGQQGFTSVYRRESSL